MLAKLLLLVGLVVISIVLFGMCHGMYEIVRGSATLASLPEYVVAAFGDVGLAFPR
jgi:hypothetical protein